jgi:hypothetical protein
MTNKAAMKRRLASKLGLSGGRLTRSAVAVNFGGTPGLKARPMDMIEWARVDIGV